MTRHIRRRHLTVRTLAFVLLASSFAAAGAPAAGAHPAPAARSGGHRLTLVKGGLNDPAAFTFTPKGLIYYLERGTGEVHILNPDTGKDRRFFKVRGVDGAGERGALGIDLHPDWPAEPFVYVFATRRVGGALKNTVLRIRASKGRGVGFRTLVQAPASSDPYHNGGRILFGPDGKLYVFIGDGHNSANAQDRTANLRGKMLRMNPDGSIPATNPFKGSRIWAYGVRNSFGFTFDPQTDRLWETENGPGCNDEINLLRESGNFGWGANESCGSLPTPRDTNNSGPSPRRLPKLWFTSTIGITGAAFCDGCGLRPRYEGKLFFGGVNGNGELRVVALNAARTDVRGRSSVVINSPSSAIYSMETAPGGRIYFSDPSSIWRLTA
jgi:glucose/arabinose dehydrogenase